MNTKMIAATLLAGLVAIPSVSFAQDGQRVAVADDDDVRKKRQGRETDLDPIPEAPQPASVEDGEPVEQQAGVGSTIAYGEAGVLELGGSAGFSASNSFSTATLSPSVGWFLADNFQVSGILNMQYVDTDNDTGVNMSAIVEPSYHLPFNDFIYGFAGLGAGVAYIQDAGAGVALQPRVGANFLVGRSGILTPAVNVGYSTVDADDDDGRTLLTVEPSVGAQVGYTVMW